MARYSTLDLKRLREVEGELGTLREGAPSAVASVGGLLTNAIGAERALLGSYRPRGDGLGIEVGGVAGIPHAIVRAIDAYIEGKAIGWTTYNPVRPEPDQRNVVMSMAEVLARTDGRPAPLMRDVYPRFGLPGGDQLRVLVCEGASLLAYVALMQGETFTSRQRRLLRRLVPSLGRRLVTERLLSDGGSTRALLVEALAEITTAAFVLADGGAVLEANAPARDWLAREGRGGRRRLADAVSTATRRASSGFRVTSVKSPGVATRYLAVRTGGVDRSCRAPARRRAVGIHAARGERARAGGRGARDADSGRRARGERAHRRGTPHADV